MYRGFNFDFIVRWLTKGRVNVMYIFGHCGSFFSRAQELERKGPRFESIIGKRAVVATNQTQTTISTRHIMYIQGHADKGLIHTPLQKRFASNNRQRPVTVHSNTSAIEANQSINFKRAGYKSTKAD